MSLGDPRRPGDDTGDGSSGESWPDTEDALKGDEASPTFSISKSLPRFCPRPVAGTDEFLSSLPRVELRSEPAAFFFDETVVALGAARWRRWSISFLRFLASSLFSSLSFRRRSCGTQSSHLRPYCVSSGGLRIQNSLRTSFERERCMFNAKWSQKDGTSLSTGFEIGNDICYISQAHQQLLDDIT